MKKKTNSIDCIAEKRNAQARIYQDIKNMTPKQEIEYFRARVRAGRFRDKWDRLRSREDRNAS
jgi:hypothetical protein